MDKVRFGRALGYGARHAARTLAEAAKAAAAPAPGNTAETRSTAPAPSSTTQGTALRDASAQVVQAHRAVTGARQQVHAQAVTAGRSAFAPLKRAGGVLWLELTGTVFGLFALAMAPGLWKLRGAVHASATSTEAHTFYVYILIFALFAYFAVSSFLRARRRSRRP